MHQHAYRAPWVDFVPTHEQSIIRRVLRDAKALIEDPENWCPEGTDGKRYCAKCAVQAVADDEDEARLAIIALDLAAQERGAEMASVGCAQYGHAWTLATFDYALAAASSPAPGSLKREGIAA